jgi:hypothetical protein
MIAKERIGDMVFLDFAFPRGGVLQACGSFALGRRLSLTFGRDAGAQLQIVHENLRFTCETKACQMGNN